MNRPRFNLVAVCLVSGIALAALVWANEDKFIYDDTDLRDPMMPYVRRATNAPVIIPVVPVIDENIIIKKIKDVIAMCTIDGVTVAKAQKYACINERILVPGDKAVPGYDVRIFDITEKEIVFELENAKVWYTVTPLVTDTTTMSSDVPIKNEEKRIP